MKTAVNRTQGRAADDGGMFASEFPIDDAPEAQELLARLGAQVCEFSAIDRAAHVRAIAAVVLKARQMPHPYARPAA